MPDDLSRSHTAGAGPDEIVVSIRRPGGDPIALSLGEYRLALIAFNDYGGDWEALLLATKFVQDGLTKETLVREHLMPLAQPLKALRSRAIDSLEMVAARHWFRSGHA